MKIAIIGQGYVGYALAIAASKAGHSIIGFDTNPKVISEIRGYGNLSNYQPTNSESDIKNQDSYIIAVPTPLDEKNLPDLSFLVNAVQLIARSASKGALVIIWHHLMVYAFLRVMPVMIVHSPSMKGTIQLIIK